MLIAQISDTHIVSKQKHWLGEPLTEIDRRLSRVIDYLNSLDPAPDVVLLTGDLTEEGDASAYRYFRELISSLKIPLYVIPGNHDLREEMRTAFINESYMPRQGFIHYAVDDYPVRLIGLDTLVEGEDYGYLCEERLFWLEQTLRAVLEKPTLIFMHHPPAKTGSKVFDNMICLASPKFEKLMMENKHFLGIIAGHYHHLCVSSFGSKLCFIAPSVAPVHHIAHPTDDHVTALELEDPAVTLHLYQEGNALISHMKRIKGKYERIDWKIIQQRQLQET